jgi:hypothetical protein
MSGIWNLIQKYDRARLFLARRKARLLRGLSEEDENMLKANF